MLVGIWVKDKCIQSFLYITKNQKRQKKFGVIIHFKEVSFEEAGSTRKAAVY